MRHKAYCATVSSLSLVRASCPATEFGDDAFFPDTEPVALSTARAISHTHTLYAAPGGQIGGHNERGVGAAVRARRDATLRDGTNGTHHSERRPYRVRPADGPPRRQPECMLESARGIPQVGQQRPRSEFARRPAVTASNLGENLVQEAAPGHLPAPGALSIAPRPPSWCPAPMQQDAKPPPAQLLHRLDICRALAQSPPGAEPRICPTPRGSRSN